MEDIIVAFRPHSVPLPFVLPTSNRLLDPTTLAVTSAAEPAAPKSAAEPAAPKSGSQPVAFKNKRDMASYAYGVETQRTLKRLGLEIDPDLLARGMKDAAAGGKLALDNAAIDGLVTDFKAVMLIRSRQEKSAGAMENQQPGLIAAGRGLLRD